MRVLERGQQALDAVLKLEILLHRALSEDAPQSVVWFVCILREALAQSSVADLVRASADSDGRV